MSRVKVSGNVSGTGTLTLSAPDTNTDRTLTLPDSSGTMVLQEGLKTVNGSSLVGSGDLGVGIGEGQTWQSVTRTSGVTYTNTTGKPIMVAATGDNTTVTSSKLWLYVDSVFVGIHGSYNSADEGSVCAIVPDGSNYYISTTYASYSVSELR